MNEESTKAGEELLKKTAQNVSALADQIEETVTQGKERLCEMQAALVDRTKRAALRTDHYVHENPWTAVGAAAGLGLIIGLLLRRR
jgi:ElaB/YqjD/DUF883 family membrane-anchored ribosome-binding protein